MRVKFLEGVASATETHYPGDEADLPDALAQRYIASGTCAAVTAAKARRGTKRETATRDQRELGVAG